VDEKDCFASASYAPALLRDKVGVKWDLERGELSPRMVVRALWPLAWRAAVKARGQLP
jgi:hypothetical protein